ncbi:MAG: hypothetical protein ABII23_07875 [bacterium]
MIQKILKSQHGFTLMMIIFIFMVVSIAAYALVIRQGQHMIMSTQKDMSDKAFQLADAGVEMAIGMLRVNPAYTRSNADNISDPISLPEEMADDGEIYVTVSTTTHAVYGDIAVINSTGTYHKAGSNPHKKAVQAIIKLEHPGTYFCASSTKFIIGSNSNWDAGGGTIYGNTIEFIDDETLGHPHIDVYKAEYHTQCIPPIDDPDFIWLDGNPAYDGFAKFYDPYLEGLPPYMSPVGWKPGPKKVSQKQFPLISVQLMKQYYDAASTNPNSIINAAPRPANWGTDANPLEYTTFSPLRDPNNGTRIWYFPNADPTTPNSTEDLYIDDLNFAGQPMLIVVNGDVYIRGQIKIGGVINIGDVPLVGFVVKGNVFIDIDNNPYDPVKFERVLFVASNGRFSALISPGTAKKSTLLFSGGALFQHPFNISPGFNERNYAYASIVTTIPNLPFLVETVEYNLVNP